MKPTSSSKVIVRKKNTYKELDPGRSIIGVSHLHLGGMTQWKKGEFSICRLRRCCVALDTRDCRSLLFSHCGLRYILSRDGVFLFLRIWFHNFDAILNGGNSQNSLSGTDFAIFAIFSSFQWSIMALQLDRREFWSRRAEWQADFFEQNFMFDYIRVYQ